MFLLGHLLGVILVLVEHHHGIIIGTSIPSNDWSPINNRRRRRRNQQQQQKTVSAVEFLNHQIKDSDIQQQQHNAVEPRRLRTEQTKLYEDDEDDEIEQFEEDFSNLVNDDLVLEMNEENDDVVEAEMNEEFDDEVAYEIDQENEYTNQENTTDSSQNAEEDSDPFSETDVLDSNNATLPESEESAHSMMPSSETDSFANSTTTESEETSESNGATSYPLINGSLSPLSPDDYDSAATMESVGTLVPTLTPSTVVYNYPEPPQPSPTVPPVSVAPTTPKPTDEPEVYEAPTDDPLLSSEDDQVQAAWKDQSSINKLQAAAAEVIHDRNVKIAGSVLGVAALAALLFTAQQLLEHPEGGCGRLCKCALACAAVICWPVRMFLCCGMCCRRRNRRGHVLVANDADAAGDEFGFSHDLELS